MWHAAHWSSHILAGAVALTSFLSTWLGAPAGDYLSAPIHFLSLRLQLCMHTWLQFRLIFADRHVAPTIWKRQASAYMGNVRELSNSSLHRRGQSLNFI